MSLEPVPAAVEASPQPAVGDVRKDCWVLADHGVSGWFGLWPGTLKSSVLLVVPIVVLVVIVDLVRRKPRRIPRHLVATAAAAVVFSFFLIPGEVWREHPNEDKGACIGCGMLICAGAAAGFGVAYLINRRLQPESEWLANHRPPPPTST